MKNKHKRTMLLVSLAMSAALGFLTITAGGGNLEPDSPPGSTMHTLDEIYNGINSLSLGSAGVTGPVAGAKVRKIAYMNVNGIQGESSDPNHQNWIEALSVHYGVKQPPTSEESSGGARSANRADFSELTVVKEIDISTPPLHLSCANGSHITSVDIEFTTIEPVTNKKVVYHKIKLEDVIVAGFAPVMSHRTAGEFIHLEEVSFNYGKITWEYIRFDSSGNPLPPVQSFWDVKTNEGGQAGN